MTEDRARPLVAFALVSLLCAVILSINLAHGRQPAVVADHLVRSSSAGSAVVFGDTLTPRATQAAGSLSASLTGVGPLSNAVAKAATTPRATRSAHPAKTTSTSKHVTPTRNHSTTRGHHAATGPTSRPGVGKHPTPTAHGVSSTGPGRSAHGPVRHGHGRAPAHTLRNDLSHEASAIRHGWQQAADHARHGWGHVRHGHGDHPRGGHHR